MLDPVIRPGAGLLLIALQVAEGQPAVLDPMLHAVPCDTESVDYNAPYRAEQTGEANGSFAASAPLVVGQPGTFAFRAKLKGAGPGAVYSAAAVKPPLHAPLSGCGWAATFNSGVAPAALTAGSATTATLGATFAASAQAYRGAPLLLSGGSAAGRIALITDYTAGRVATLVDSFAVPLGNGNSAAMPPNWTYAPSTPSDAASRNALHPYVTIGWFEDGTLHTWQDCRGMVDLDGTTGKPGYGAFSFTGIYAGKTDAALPTNVIYAGHSAPLLVQGTGVQPVFQVNRRGLAISKWSLKNGGAIESPDDPNTPIGFGGGQISERMQMLEIDPLTTHVAVRNALAEIAAFSTYPAGLIMGATGGNRVALTLPIIQPVETSPTMRGKLRAETLRYQATSPSRDTAGRDGDAVLCFF